MSPYPFRAVVAPVLALTTLVACSSSSSTAPEEPVNTLPPLVAAVWYAHAAEGQPLPALVAHRLEQGDLVQDFLDSAQVQITADGRWTRRLWLTRYRNGSFDAPVPSQEAGTWVATDTAYIFTTEPGGVRFSLASLTPGQVVELPLRDVTRGYIAATVRTVPPPEMVVGTYRVTSVRGVDVPSAMYVINDHVEEGRTVSIHFIVDSARLVLFGNRRYEHTIHYSEWEGPNNGPPTQRRFRWRNGDFGEWRRDNTLIRFESGWLQNLRFDGTVYNRNTMELLHGLSHGDPAVPVRYSRVELPTIAGR